MRWFNIQPKLSKLQKEAQRKALQTYQSDPEKYKNTMFCPFCGEPLIDSGKTDALETLSEHVSDPNGYVSQKKVYVCSSKEFYKDFLGCKYGIFWKWNGPEGGIESGGAYRSDLWFELLEKLEKDDKLDGIIKTYLYSEKYQTISSAFNTLECNSEVSLYRRGLPHRKVLFKIKRFKLTLNFYYFSDNFGRIKRTYLNLGYLWREGSLDSIGTWPWEIWSWELKDYKKYKKRAKKVSGEDYYKNLLKAYCHSPNRSWSYKVFEKVNEFLHFWEVRDLKKHYNISEIPERFELNNILTNEKYN